MTIVYYIFLGCVKDEADILCTIMLIYIVWAVDCCITTVDCLLESSNEEEWEDAVAVDSSALKKKAKVIYKCYT